MEKNVKGPPDALWNESFLDGHLGQTFHIYFLLKTKKLYSRHENWVFKYFWLAFWETYHRKCDYAQLLVKTTLCASRRREQCGGALRDSCVRAQNLNGFLPTGAKPTFSFEFFADILKTIDFLLRGVGWHLNVTPGACNATRMPPLKQRMSRSVK